MVEWKLQQQLSRRPQNISKSDFVTELAEKAAKRGWRPPQTSTRIDQTGLKFDGVRWLPKKQKTSLGELSTAAPTSTSCQQATSQGINVSLAAASHHIATTAPSGPAALPFSFASQPEPTVLEKKTPEEDPVVKYDNTSGTLQQAKRLSKKQEIQQQQQNQQQNQQRHRSNQWKRDSSSGGRPPSSQA